MEITATISSINTGISRNVTGTSEQEETRPNAFGIGEANRAEVELSPQARILQQTDVNQRELRERLEAQRQAAQDKADQAREDEAKQQPNGTRGFADIVTRETSDTSTTNVRRNNLRSETVAGVYQAIAKLV